MIAWSHRVHMELIYTPRQQENGKSDSHEITWNQVWHADCSRILSSTRGGLISFRIKFVRLYLAVLRIVPRHAGTMNSVEMPVDMCFLAVKSVNWTGPTGVYLGRGGIYILR